MRQIDGQTLYAWMSDTLLPKCMLERSKDAEDAVLEVMQHVREMQAVNGNGPHMAPSDGTEPLGVTADKNKPHPRGQVNWTKDMENAGKNYLEWKHDMMKAMWSLYWFEESKKMRTDLSPEDVECCFDQLKRDAAVWIRMATQMDAGQRGKSGNRERIQWYKQHGICYWCGQADAVIAGLCGACYKKYRRCYKRYQAEHRAQINARQRERCQKKRAAGMCIQCGRQPARPGRILCQQCAQQKSARAKRNYWQNKVERPPGQCRWCERPAAPGHQFCEAHLAKVRDSMANARAQVIRANHPWRKR